MNPYTGCDHGCIYCYATSYIPRFSECRPKKGLIPKLTKEAATLKGEIISMSNSSDPYPNIEAKAGLTRRCLEALSSSNCRIQIITKSDLVTRDIDLLKRVRSMVSMSITTDDDEIGKKLEPFAPLPSKRLEAVQTLIDRSIPTSVRIDPIIPSLNDDINGLIKKVAAAGVKHITCSTYKVRPDNWLRFSKAFPEIAEKLKPFYFGKGKRMGGYTYLPAELRCRLMKKAYELTQKHGVRLGVCREKLGCLNTVPCDGSWLIAHTISD